MSKNFLGLLKKQVSPGTEVLDVEDRESPFVPDPPPERGRAGVRVLLLPTLLRESLDFDV